MNITFKELRDIKHSLPTGSVGRIANKLNLSEQTVRNFFGAQKFDSGEITDFQLQPGPNGGIINMENTDILEMAKEILKENHSS